MALKPNRPQVTTIDEAGGLAADVIGCGSAPRSHGLEHRLLCTGLPVGLQVSEEAVASIREAWVFRERELTCIVQTSVTLEGRSNHHQITVQIAVVAPPQSRILYCRMGR